MDPLIIGVMLAVIVGVVVLTLLAVWRIEEIVEQSRDTLRGIRSDSAEERIAAEKRRYHEQARQLALSAARRPPQPPEQKSA